ncbi:MAG: acyl-CoA dehydrogenase family protein [Candidatus Tectomicrobia bacterium]|nr:acyl-CoA dehydrogenase family protein [Candidatus Tectomicrobia bacterium]
MDLSIPEEVEIMRQEVSRFVDEELAPHEKEVEEREEIPAELRASLRKKAAELGLLSLGVPEECGGAGLDILAQAILWETFGKVSLPLVLGILPEGYELLAHGTKAQQDAYLAPCLSGDATSCVAVTETTAGAEEDEVALTARRDGDHFILDGKKIFVANGDVADFAVVLARSDEAAGPRHGLSCFVVDRGSPGCLVGERRRTLGLHGVNFVELTFDACRVSAEHVIGEVGAGFALMRSWRDEARLKLSAWCVGMGERLLDGAKEYAKQRYTFGKPIAERQAIQWMLAESATDLRATRMMAYHAAWKKSLGEEAHKEVAMVKVFATEMFHRLTDRALQIHGGLGYTKDLHYERYYRDARMLRVLWGGSESLRSDISESILAGA